VFIVAVKYFLKKLKSKEILNALNKAYSETESPEEATLREKSKTYYSKKILKEELTAFDSHIRKQSLLKF
jgi:hypothetical protein